MKIVAFLAGVIVLKQTFNRRVFSKNTASHKSSRLDVFFKNFANITEL